jgi:ATP-dependent DNA helicase RecG
MGMRKMVEKAKSTDPRKEPRFYMELAVAAMKKSVEDVNKNIPSPNVGAVLVFPDGSYETAYRGEFRDGDHAEYTLLDKKFRTKDLSDCWLFATLEPCGPKARSEKKTCCAERIGNARIKKVWYGVQELNPKAKGGKKLLEEKYGVKVLPFDLDLHKEIQAFNKSFNDWVEEENQSQKEALEIVSGPLQKAIKNTDTGYLSKEALELYIARTKRTFAYDSDDLKRDLISKGLLEVDEKTGETRPTGDCILLLGKQPRDKFPQASVKAKVDYGAGQEPDTESFDDALVLVPDYVEKWAKKVIPESMDRSEFRRKKVSHFPTPVIREAIINAIIHRDYNNRGAKVELEITPEKIEVRSPGGPISPNTLKDLQNFTAISQTRNPELAYIFNLMEFMEETGVGMDTYRTMREKFDLPLPVIDFKKSNLIVTFPRTMASLKSVSQLKGIDQLNQEELIGYEFVKLQGSLKRKDYEDKFRFDKKKAERHLNKMVELELVKRKGSGPGTYYEFIAK